MAVSTLVAMSTLALLAATCSSTAAATCAPQCVCVHTVMLCNRKGLTELPQGTWPDVVFLDVSHNSISNIDALGQRFPGLVVLRMRDNALTALHLSALVGNLAPQGLKGADLSFNAVEQVVFQQGRDAADLFSNAVEQVLFQHSREATSSVFSTLLLTSNRIASLHPDAFRALPNLKQLALNDNPLVLGPQTFLSHALLKELDLSGANASAVSGRTFQELPSLNLLGLQGSAVKDVEGVFVHLQALDSLYLEGNEITKIETASFPSSNSLKRLSLDRNPLQRIDTKALGVKDGGELTIEDTPLSCACAYEEVSRWAEEHRVELFADCNGSSICHFNEPHLGRRKAANGKQRISFHYPS